MFLLSEYKKLAASTTNLTMDSEEEDNVFSTQSPLRVDDEEEEEEEDDEEEDGRIFNTWMQRCRGAGQNKEGQEEQEEKGEEIDGRTPESNLDPPIRMRTERRASLPSPVRPNICVHIIYIYIYIHTHVYTV